MIRSTTHVCLKSTSVLFLLLLLLIRSKLFFLLMSLLQISRYPIEDIPPDSSSSDAGSLLVSNVPPIVKCCMLKPSICNICTLPGSRREIRLQCTKCQHLAAPADILDIYMMQNHSPVFSSPTDSSQTLASLQSPLATESNAQERKRPEISLLSPSSSPIRNCPACSFVERKEGGLRAHIQKRHSCRNCDFIEIVSGDLESHLDVKHGIRRPKKITHSGLLLKAAVRNLSSVFFCWNELLSPFLQTVR
ncbi:hypothetical protein AVEN_201863-1 [Araneus ventricosus]|uniref:C2H2-type domain-containing protein n=1 Tax=Araneus ventricosus TaxID=182803 RepID=A0A4Y2KLZ3_ARAVE|nr:hypothetical protein AVEN_201863-1 [Araneus ventricosus]